MARIAPSAIQQVQDWLALRPAIASCLHLGIVNYSQLGRMIEENSDANHDAIVSALRRLRDETNSRGQGEALRQAVAESRLDLRTNVGLLTYPSSHQLLDRLASSLHSGDAEERVHVFHGWEDLRVVADEDILTALEISLAPEEPIERVSNLVELNLHTEAAFVPGFLALTTGALAAQGINVVDAASCRSDHIFLIGADDLAPAVAAFDGLR